MEKSKSKPLKKADVKIKLNKKIILIAVVIILIIIAAYLVYKKPKTAMQGDTVFVDYTGMLDNGQIFDTTMEGVARAAGVYHQEREYKPIMVVIGAGRYLPGFEDAIYGMKEGEKKTITIPPERAYGEYDAKKIVSINRSLVKTENITAGDVITTGDKFFKVLEANETSVIVDANHPLAGKTLVFEIRLIKITQ